MPKPPKPTPLPPFDPKAKVALQIEFEAKDRAIFLRIATAYERIAAALEKIATPPKAENLNPTVTEIPKE